ncbi:MAG: hypothetical protein AAF657_39865, partial [Acidobacteriota bacterium]
MMTRIQILSLVVFSLAVPAVAEDAGEGLARQALEAYEADDPATCLQLYRQAFDAGRESASSDYNAACCAALAGDSSSALELLAMAAE